MSDQLGHLNRVKDHSLSRLSLVGSNGSIGGTSQWDRRFAPPPAMPQHAGELWDEHADDQG